MTLPHDVHIEAKTYEIEDQPREKICPPDECPTQPSNKACVEASVERVDGNTCTMIVDAVPGLS
jgi:hypothetical protein